MGHITVDHYECMDCKATKEVRRQTDYSRWPASKTKKP